MKKFLAIVAVAAIMTACNSGTEEKPVVIDTVKTESPVTDAKAVTDTAAKMMSDTAHKMMDTTKMK